MLSPGAIAGIVIGSLAGLMIFLILPIWYVLRRHRKDKEELRLDEHAVEADIYPDDSLSFSGHGFPLPTLLSQSEGGYGRYDSEPVNFGSMQVKGIRDVRGDREREGVF